MPKFEIYQDKAGEFRWRLIADNGKQIAACGEGYKTKASVKNGITRVMETNKRTPVFES